MRPPDGLHPWYIEAIEFVVGIVIPVLLSLKGWRWLRG